MDYISILDVHQGKDIIYETSNIDNIQLLQSINIGGKKEPYYLVLISYKDRERESVYISDSQWIRWNERNNNANN